MLLSSHFVLVRPHMLTYSGNGIRMHSKKTTLILFRHHKVKIRSTRLKQIISFRDIVFYLHANMIANNF